MARPKDFNFWRGEDSAALVFEGEGLEITAEDAAEDDAAEVATETAAETVEEDEFTGFESPNVCRFKAD